MTKLPSNEPIKTPKTEPVAKLTELPEAVIKYNRLSPIGAENEWETTGNRFDDLTTLGGQITNALNEVEVKDLLLDAPVDDETNEEDK